MAPTLRMDGWGAGFRRLAQAYMLWGLLTMLPGPEFGSAGLARDLSEGTDGVGCELGLDLQKDFLWRE